VPFLGLFCLLLFREAFPFLAFSYFVATPTAPSHTRSDRALRSLYVVGKPLVFSFYVFSVLSASQLSSFQEILVPSFALRSCLVFPFCAIVVICVTYFPIDPAISHPALLFSRMLPVRSDEGLLFFQPSFSFAERCPRVPSAPLFPLLDCRLLLLFWNSSPPPK